MHKCSRTEKILQDSLNKDIIIEENAEFMTHVNHCPVCSRKLNQIRNLHSILKAHNSDEDLPPDNFIDGLCLKLDEITPESSFLNSHLIKYGIAAAVLIIISYFSFNHINPTYKTNIDNAKPVLIASSTADINTPITIELIYHSSDEYKNVNFNISLGKGIAFFSTAEGGEKISAIKNHRFSGSLAKGDNLIPFVVKVSEQGKWKIDTFADYNGFRHKHQIILTTSKDTVTIAYYKLPKIKIGENS